MNFQIGQVQTFGGRIVKHRRHRRHRPLRGGALLGAIRSCLLFALVASLTACGDHKRSSGQCGEQLLQFRLTDLRLDWPNAYSVNVDGDPSGERDNQLSFMLMATNAAVTAFDLKERFMSSVPRGETGLLFDVSFDNLQDSCATVRVHTAAPIVGDTHPSSHKGGSIEPNIGQPIATLRGHIRDNRLLLPLPGDPDYHADAAQELVLNVQLKEALLKLPIQGLHLSGIITESGIRDGEIHGSLDYSYLLQHFAGVVATETTSLINANSTGEVAKRVIGMLEQKDTSGHPSVDKCKAAANCCHTSPTTCRILTEEVLANSQYQRTVKPDLKMFENGRLRPQPLAAPESLDAVSVGLGFSAQATAFKAPCDEASGWCRVPSLPPNLKLNLQAVWAGARDDIWVVGENSIILHYDGHQWKEHDILSKTILRSVWGFTSTGEVFVAGDNGLVMRYKGGEFVDANSPTHLPLRDIWGTSPTDVWVVGENATILHFDGASWVASTSPASVSGQRLDAVFGTSSKDVWVTGLSGSLIHFDGTQWTAKGASMEKLFDGWVSREPPFELWVVTSSGVPRRFDGKSWHLGMGANSGGDFLLGIHGERRDNLWAVGDGATAIHYDGSRWSPLTSLPLPTNGVGTPSVILAKVFAIGGTDVWMVGSPGIILHCTKRNRPNACFGHQDESPLPRPASY